MLKIALLVLFVLIMGAFSFGMNCHGWSSGNGVLDTELYTQTLDNLITAPDSCRDTTVCSNQCKTHNIFLYDIAAQVKSSEFAQQVFEDVCLKRKFGDKETFLTATIKLVDSIAKGYPKGKTYISKKGRFAVKVVNPYFQPYYKFVTDNVNKCTEKNVAFLRALDKKCMAQPDFVDKLKLESIFNPALACKNLKPDELIPQQVISQVLQDNFMFLIGSKDEVSAEKYCECAHFNKYISKNKKRILSWTKAEKKQRKADPALQAQRQEFTKLELTIASNVVKLNNDCALDIENSKKQDKASKKDKENKYKKDLKEFKAQKALRIKDLTKNIAKKLKEAYDALNPVETKREERKENRHEKKRDRKENKTPKIAKVAVPVAPNPIEAPITLKGIKKSIQNKIKTKK